MSLEDRPTELANWIVNKLKSYQQEHLYKYLGAGVSEKVLEYSPQLASRLWQELDIVPLVLEHDVSINGKIHRNRHATTLVDEEADSMARKALM